MYFFMRQVEDYLTSKLLCLVTVVRVLFCLLIVLFNYFYVTKYLFCLMLNKIALFT